MSILVGLEAILKLGLPMVVISWLAFKWMSSSSEIASDVKHKDFMSRVKKPKELSKNTTNKPAQFLLRKWARFGSGFYGLVGFWTLLVIEANGVFYFFRSGGFSNFENNGLVSLIVGIFIKQVTNFVTAFLWFGYWPGPTDSIWLWIIVAFLGYRIGIELARGRLRLPKFSKKKEFIE